MGIVFGAIPGMTVTMGVALFLPITFGMEPVNGLSLLLGFILGPMVEVNLRRGLMRSKGDLTPFITEPISGVEILITLIAVTMTVLSEVKKYRQKVNARLL